LREKIDSKPQWIVANIFGALNLKENLLKYHNYGI